MSDLATMYGGSPNTASMMMGQNQGADLAQKAATLQQMMLQNQQSAAMNPIDQEFRRGQVAQQAAALPGVVGQSQTLAAHGKEDEALVQPKLQEAFSRIATQVGKDGVDQMAQDAERLQHVGAILSKYPVAAHKQIFQDYMQKTGGNIQNPIVQGMMSMPDDQFAKAVGEVGTAMATTGTKFNQERALHKDTADANERIQKAHDATREEVANVQAASREKVAQERIKAVSALTPDKAIAKLEMVPESERTQAEWSALNKLQKYMLTKAAMTGNAVTPTVLNQATPLQNAASAADALTPPQAATSHAVPAAGGNLQSAVVKAGWSYEPNKYHYRLDANGIAERALKESK